MRTYNSIALALISATLATAPCWGQGDPDLKAQVRALQQQAAALTQQIQILQEKIDQKADPARQTSTLKTTAPETAAPKAAASVTGASHTVANSTANHGFFERKPGDRMT